MTASSFHSIFTQVPKTLNSAVALLVGFLKRLGDSSSGFSLSQFVLFHIGFRTMDPEVLKSKLFLGFGLQKYILTYY